MISKCSSQIVMYLIGSGAIKEEDSELYTYGFFVLLSYVFFFCIVVLWGILFKIFFESMLLYVLFGALRGYAGGFHSRSEHRCTVYTITALFVTSLGIKLLQIANQPVIAITFLCLGSLIVLLLSPLDTPEKPLSKKERHHYRKLSYIILSIMCILSLSSAILQKYGMLNASSLCVMLESVLLLLGKAQQKGPNTPKEQIN